jgi:3-oxoacyl-[acyl-carrier protein] reductase
MSDFLVELGANPTARNLIKTLGLPLPMPQKLARGRGPWESRPLEGRTVVVGAAVGAALPALATALGEAGATSLVEGEVGPGTAWADAAEAWGRPATAIAPGVEPIDDVHALVLDATGVATVDDLKALKDFFQPRLRSLRRSGRAVVIGRPYHDTKDVEAACARKALEGFVRSLAKEVGGKGITANLIVLGEGRDAALAGPLRFLLSERSAFVDGQPLYVDGGRAAGETPRWTRPLDGKVVVVTGAARGIGAATAETLAREGAHVLCLDRPDDAEPLAEVAARIGGEPVGIDVTQADAGQRILAAARARGGVDVIVHNAGITRDKTLQNMDDARWDLTLDVNLRAILRITDAIAPEMKPGGRIVALSSVAGIAGNFGQTNYAASKAGVVAFVETLAPKLARRGITVNGIAPGFIETRLTAAIPAATREAGRRLSALVQGGLPIDIAEAVTFLASPGAWGVSGHVLRVCGGAFIGA